VLVRRAAVATSDDPQQNQPFVSGEDRPPVQITPDTPVSELRVRDLASLLGSQAAQKKLEIAKEKPEKFEKSEKFEIIKEKPEKHEHKEKPEKFEHKEKPEKFEHKEKPEKHEHKEKPEFKEKFEIAKEKFEIAQEVAKLPDGPTPDPLGGGGDPRIDQLIETVSRLQRDIADMNKRMGGS